MDSNMTAINIINQAQALGIRLESRGDKLIVDAPKAALRSELVGSLRSHKAEILKSLEVCHGLTLADLQQAAGPDWSEIENDPATLEDLAHSITIRRMRERGEVPPDYTATTVCRHCGPVPIYPGVAERVVFCPWCFNRVKGLPMPKAPTKPQVQDLGPAMLKRDGCEGHKPSDYRESEKVRVDKLIKSEVNNVDDTETRMRGRKRYGQKDEKV